MKMTRKAQIKTQRVSIALLLAADEVVLASAEVGSSMSDAMDVLSSPRAPRREHFKMCLPICVERAFGERRGESTGLGG
jgi:hypothetical protein